MPFNILTIFFISILFPKIFSFVGTKKGMALFSHPVVCKQFRRPSEKGDGFIFPSGSL